MKTILSTIVAAGFFASVAHATFNPFSDARQALPRGEGYEQALPHTSNEWVLNDTYPDDKRLQHPYLYHIPSDRRIALGHFYSPAFYTGEWRCDNHPRSSNNGRLVCIDSPHHSGRQLYLVDVSSILDAIETLGALDAPAVPARLHDALRR